MAEVQETICAGSVAYVGQSMYYTAKLTEDYKPACEYWTLYPSKA
jgi:hypothetical protein